MPLHAQIAERIQLAIASGALAPGDQLPTVRQLSVDLRVNSNTVARVYSELERAGVLETFRGKGTFVRQRPKVDAKSRERRLRHMCSELAQSCAREGYALGDIIAVLREMQK